VVALLPDARGAVWILREAVTESSGLHGAPLLERYGLGGHLERQVTFPDGAIGSSFVIHPSGERFWAIVPTPL
jgi:hypothetical protein